MKRILMCIMIAGIVLGSIQNIYAANSKVQDPSTIGNGWVDNDLKQALGGTWANVSIVIQVLAIACIVFAGLRYMFASADQKADIKHGMRNLVIGSALVFVTIPIIRFATISVSRLIDPSLPSEQLDVNKAGVHDLIVKNGQIITSHGADFDKLNTEGPVCGDEVIYDGYHYKYGYSWDYHSWSKRCSVGSESVWGVVVADTSFSEYPDMLDELYGKKVSWLNGTFEACTTLKKAPHISINATEMENCFSNCTVLDEMPEIPDTVTDLSYAFSSTAITNVSKLPEKVENLERAFMACSYLETVGNIPSAVTNLDGTFGQCYNLRSVGNIYSEYIETAYHAFWGCSSLTSIGTWRGAVADMSGCFLDCKNLTSLSSNLPISKDYTECFSGCEKLTGKIEIMPSVLETEKIDYADFEKYDRMFNGTKSNIEINIYFDENAYAYEFREEEFSNIIKSWKAQNGKIKVNLVITMEDGTTVYK